MNDEALEEEAAHRGEGAPGSADKEEEDRHPGQPAEQEQEEDRQPHNFWSHQEFFVVDNHVLGSSTEDKANRKKRCCNG